MKEDVIKFRKCLSILIKEKGYTNAKAMTELGISEPTFYKVINSDLDELKGLRASTLGLIQDFNKKHCNDVNYAGVESAPESVVDKAIAAMKKTGDEIVKEAKIRKARFEIHPEPEQKKEPVAPDPIQIPGVMEQAANPFQLFLDALKLVPANVSIQIRINDN